MGLQAAICGCTALSLIPPPLSHRHHPHHHRHHHHLNPGQEALPASGLCDRARLSHSSRKSSPMYADARQGSTRISFCIVFFWHPSIASPKTSLMCARRGYLEYGFALCLTMILLTLKLCNYEKVSVTLTCWRGFDEPNHICQYSLIGLGGG